MSTPNKTKLPLLAGCLTIIAASPGIFIGGAFINFWLDIVQHHYSVDFKPETTIFMIYALVAVIGLVGGIMSLRRRMFVLSLVGASFVLLSSFNVSILTVQFIMGNFHLLEYYLLLLCGLLTALILSLVSIILLAKSKSEFS